SVVDSHAATADLRVLQQLHRRQSCPVGELEILNSQVCVTVEWVPPVEAFDGKGVACGHGQQQTAAARCCSECDGAGGDTGSELHDAVSARSALGNGLRATAGII